MVALIPRRLIRRALYPAPAWDRVAAGDDLVETATGHALIHRSAPERGWTVVYLHGNGSDIGSIAPLGDLFEREGIGFAAPEYPGYGPVPGPAHEDGLVEAARAGMAELRRRGVPVDRTVLVGESLGSAVAARLAVDGEGVALALVSPFTSMTAMFRTFVPRLPAVFVPDRFDTESLAERIAVPTLLLHGEEDRLVPPAMSEALAEVIPDARRLTIPDRDHNTLWEPPSRLFTELVAFVRGVAGDQMSRDEARAMRGGEGHRGPADRLPAR